MLKKLILAAAAVALMANTAFAETIIFKQSDAEDPDAYQNVFYGRGMELQTEEAGERRGNLYATCEYYYHPDGKSYMEHFPIFESSDCGETFTHISDVYDTEFNAKKYIEKDGKYTNVPEGSAGAVSYFNERWSLIWEPMLFELPASVGTLPGGSVLCAGMSKSANHCALVIYYSTDGLRTWSYLSTVAEGGLLKTGVGSALWEPFFVYENNALYCFYSDERNMTGGGQRLVYQKSSDALTWEEPVKICDFEKENGKYRPGMPVVTKLIDGRYAMVYEGVNMDSPTRIYYKTTSDINEWKSDERGTMLPRMMWGGSPYCATLTDGTIVVGCEPTRKLIYNTDNLATNTWHVVDTDVSNAYTRSLFTLLRGSLLITSGGPYSPDYVRYLSCGIQNIVPHSLIPTKTENVTGSTPWGKETPDYSHSADKASDGDFKTYFDGYPDGYVTIDLGAQYNIDAIGFVPREDIASRMLGGIFYASNDKEKWEKFYTVKETPAIGVITLADKADFDSQPQNKYRYIKYTSDGTQYCNIAELRVYSYDASSVNVNGKLLECASEIAAGNMLLAQPVFEELGYQSTRSGRSIGFSRGSENIIIEVGNKNYRINTAQHSLETAPVLKNDEIYVPSEIFADLGYNITFDGDRQRTYVCAHSTIMSNEERLQEDADTLLWGVDIEKVEENVSLPSVGIFGSTVSWISADASIITDDGVVTRPTLGKPDTSVTLTATLSYGSETLSREFSLTVKAIRGEWLSTADWSYYTIEKQSGEVIFQYDITPELISDGLLAICGEGVVPNAWNSAAITVRILPSGVMDARNGAAFDASNTVSYEAGKTYHIRIKTNVKNKTYSVYVIDPDGITRVLADNFAYRNDSPSISALDKVVVRSGNAVAAALFTVENFKAVKSDAVQYEYEVSDTGYRVLNSDVSEGAATYVAQYDASGTLIDVERKIFTFGTPQRMEGERIAEKIKTFFWDERLNIR